MTELNIIKLLSKSLDDQKFIFQIPNAFIYNWECDYWIMDKEGVTKEFEIKISRGDYFKDLKKDKHKAEGANFFYYVCPKDLIKPSEVDKKYGLIYVSKHNAFIVKRASRLNNNRFTDWRMLAVKMYYRWRQLWIEMYLANKITAEQYRDGKIISELSNVKQINETGKLI
jgi:hypothetical protein